LAEVLRRYNQNPPLDACLPVGRGEGEGGGEKGSLFSMEVLFEGKSGGGVTKSV